MLYFDIKLIKIAINGQAWRTIKPGPKSRFSAALGTREPCHQYAVGLESENKVNIDINKINGIHSKIMNLIFYNQFEVLLNIMECLVIFVNYYEKKGKQPPLKLKSAKINPRYIQDIQDKYKIPSGRRPSPARAKPGAARSRAVPCMARCHAASCLSHKAGSKKPQQSSLVVFIAYCNLLGST